MSEQTADAVRGLKPFFTYYGGKWRAAPRYPAPTHARLVEPFAGAAGYALRHYRHAVELYDVDTFVAGLWDYLIHVSADEVRRLPLEVDHVDGLGVCPEAKSLIGFWLNKGTAMPRKSPSRWMRDGLWPNSFWGPVIRERIASQVDAIRHWKIEQKSYKDVDTFDAATWFVDPPYAVSGHHYRSSEVDYTHLAYWCRSLEGQVMVCEQAGADWLPFEPFLTTKATEGRHGKSVSLEVIWTPAHTDGEADA